MPALDPAAVQPPVTSPTATVSPETPTDRPAAATSRGRWPWELVWLLVALAIALPAGWPLLTTAGIPVSDDGLFHLYRLDEFARVWPAQAPIVRWSDRFMYGAGFPFFTYYAPLVYYLGTALMALGADTTAAFKLLLALAPVLASVTMYAWTRREFASRPAGLLGAAAYVYAPYFLVDIYRRGSVADCLAFVLLPACLLTARRLIESPSVRRSLVAAATMALLIVTHNAMAFFFLPLLGLYAIGVAGRENLTPRPSPAWGGEHAQVLRWTLSPPHAGEGRGVRFSLPHLRQRLAPFAVAGVLALGLAAWFWVPALVERDALDLTFQRTGYFDYHQHWGDGWPAVQTPAVFDWGTPFRVGLVQAGLMLAGWLACLARRERRGDASCWGGVALVAVGLMWPGSEPIWDRVPLLAYAEFPWRLLPFVGLAGAVLTAALAVEVPRRLGLSGRAAVGGGLGVALVLGGALALAGLGGLRPEWQVVSDFRPLAISNATRIAGWNVPPAGMAPMPTDAGGVTLLGAGGSFSERRYVFDVALPTTVVLHAFAVPGWELTVDGRPARYRAVAPDGLLAFDLHAGRHAATLRLVATDLEAASGAASLIALAAVALAALWRLSRHWPGRPVRPLPTGLLGLALLSALALSLPRPGVASGPADFFKPLNVPVTDAVQLGGYAASLDPVVPSRLQVTLYWQARRAVGEDLPIHVWLVDAAGRAAGVRNVRAVGDALPTDRWPAGLLLADTHTLTLPPDFDLASARLKVGLSRWDSPTASRTLLGEVAVSLADGAPLLSPGPPAAGPPIGALGGVFRLTGATLAQSANPVEVRAGETLHLAATWQAAAPVRRDYVFTAHLLDPAGRAVAAAEVEPADGRWPTGVWSAGDGAPLQFALTPPPELAAGRYRLVLGAYAVVDHAPLPALDRDGHELPGGLPVPVALVAHPPGLPRLPDAATPVGADFGGTLRLVGWAAGAGQGDLTLFWQAARRPERDYTLFVHVLDSAGTLVAQRDAPPLDGAYPTSLWTAGRLVAVPMHVELPPGTDPSGLRLFAGTYTSDTVERLTLPDGAAVVELGRWPAPR